MAGSVHIHMVGKLKSDGSGGISGYSGKHNLVGTTSGLPGIHKCSVRTHSLGLKAVHSITMRYDWWWWQPVLSVHPAAGPVSLFLPCEVRIRTSASTAQPGWRMRSWHLLCSFLKRNNERMNQLACVALIPNYWVSKFVLLTVKVRLTRKVKGIRESFPLIFASLWVNLWQRFLFLSDSLVHFNKKRHFELILSWIYFCCGPKTLPRSRSH